MLDVEERAYNALPPTKRDRFKFLLTMRHALARTTAELFCWGVGFDDTPVIDRQLVLLEDALTNLVGDVQLASSLRAEWVAHDASLLHPTGTAKAWRSVCQHGGYGTRDLLEGLSPARD